MRYSRQREVVYSAVCSTTTHPDAAYVYAQAQKVIPNISLGTVYRNLAELCQLGQICKIGVQKGVERYDGNVCPHAHFVCTCCGSVLDLPTQDICVTHNVKGVTQTQVTLYGVCPKCQNNHYQTALPL